MDKKTVGLVDKVNKGTYHIKILVLPESSRSNDDRGKEIGEITIQVKKATTFFKLFKRAYETIFKQDWMIGYPVIEYMRELISFNKSNNEIIFSFKHLPYIQISEPMA